MTTKNSGLENAYVLYEDRNDDKQFTINTIVTSEVTENISLNGKIAYKRLRSQNFAKVIDLLGGLGYLDIDPFGATEDAKQNNLLNPNRIVGKGDNFKYNFNLNSEIIAAFVQAQFNYNSIDFYTAFYLTSTSHQLVICLL